MEDVLQWQLDIIRAVQLYSNQPLTFVMRIITGFGSSSVYVILLPLVYWCLDEKKGIRLGLAVMLSVWINIALKFFLNQPRPFFEGYDPLLGMIPERMGGFPSGHAQTSLVLWIIIVSWGKSKWLYGTAAFVCLLVGFSRVYLGVHFPTDVLGGWILGGFVLCVYFFLGPRIERLLVRGGFRAEMITAAVSAFIMILYRPGPEAIMPGGMLLGMAAGYSLNRRYIGFRADLKTQPGFLEAPFKSSAVFGKIGAAKYICLLLRFVLGISVIALIFLAFEKLIPENQFSDYYLLLYFSRFTLMGLWAYAGAPWLFGFLHLSESKRAD